jgi:hypothetical protein
MSELPDTARIHRLLAAQNPDAAAWALPITFHQVPHARWLAAALAVLRETPSHVDAIGHLLESLDWTPEVRHLVEVELTRGALEGAPRTMLWLLYAHHEDTTPPGPAPPADGLGGWLLEGLSRGYRRWREHLGNAHARHRAEAPRDGELPGLVAEALDLLEGVDLDDDDDDHLLLEVLAQVDGLLLWARDGTPDATDATADLDVLGPRAAQVHEALEDDARGARWAWALRAAAQQRRLLQRASLDELLAHSHDHRATWTWQELLPNALRGAPDLAAVLAGPGRDLPQGRVVGWVGASHPVVVADWLLARRSDPEASQVVWYGPLDEAPEVVRALLPHLADDALSRAAIEAMGAIRETWCADAVVAHLLDWTRLLEDDRPIWRAASRLADRRLAAPLAHPGLQHSPGAAWVTRVLSDVWGLPIDRGQRDFADDYQRAVPEFPALRIRCDDCGAWGDVPLQSGTYAADDADVVDGWDGFTPEEPVTCPWCGSVDRYQASRPSVRALARNADELPVRLRAGVVARLPDGSVAARVSTLFEGLRTHAERVDSAPAWLALADAQALHGPTVGRRRPAGHRARSLVRRRAPAPDHRVGP